MAFYGWENGDVRLADGPVRTPAELYDALSDLWTADTCTPRMRARWSAQNPTLGQCAITAFLAQDLFGGEVYGVPLGDGNYHCFNVVDGVAFDLTSEQFGDEALDYAHCPLQRREDHFARAEKKARYEQLKRALAEKLARGGA